MAKYILASIAAVAAGALLGVTAAAQDTAHEPARPDTARPDATKPDTTKPDTAPKGDAARQEPTKEAPKPGTMTAPAPGAAGDQGQKAQGRLDKPVHVDQTLSLPVENGCTYTAHVRGTVAPMKDNAHGNGAAAVGSAEQKVSSDLTISAVVSCPNATDLKVSDRSAVANVNRTDMLNALALRGSIMSSASGQRCMYVPNLDLGADGKMMLDGVGFVCPTTGAGNTGGAGATPHDTTGGANQPKK